MLYVGVTTSTVKATVVPNNGRVATRAWLHNPNSTSVAGTVYLIEKDTVSEFGRFNADARSPVVVVDGPLSLSGDQSLEVALDSAPATQLAIFVE